MDSMQLFSTKPFDLRWADIHLRLKRWASLLRSSRLNPLCVNTAVETSAPLSLEVCLDSSANLPGNLVVACHWHFFLLHWWSLCCSWPSTIFTQFPWRYQNLFKASSIYSERQVRHNQSFGSYKSKQFCVPSKQARGWSSWELWDATSRSQERRCRVCCSSRYKEGRWNPSLRRRKLVIFSLRTRGAGINHCVGLICHSVSR